MVDAVAQSAGRTERGQARGRSRGRFWARTRVMVFSAIVDFALSLCRASTRDGYVPVRSFTFNVPTLGATMDVRAEEDGDGVVHG